MRDVIIVGAGGGGAVIAKELASRGLDVLLLEAGPRFAQSGARLDAFRERREQSGDRLLPVRSRRSVETAMGARARAEHVVRSALRRGGTTNHYQGNSPRAAPGVFVDYQGADRQRL